MGKSLQVKGRHTETEGGVDMMDNITRAKARETRAKNMAVRAAQRVADTELKQAAKRALQYVFEAKDATADQVLRAAELLVKLSNH